MIPVSAMLQTFYNVEISRYVIATGEAPIVGWGRVPPGYQLWLPFSFIVIYFAFIFGGWAASAGAGPVRVGPRAGGRPDEPRTPVAAIGLLFLVFLITVVARKITRTLELANWVMVGVILPFLIIIDLAIVPPPSGGTESAASSPRPRRPLASPRPHSARSPASPRSRRASTGT